MIIIFISTVFCQIGLLLDKRKIIGSFEKVESVQTQNTLCTNVSNQMKGQMSKLNTETASSKFQPIFEVSNWWGNLMTSYAMHVLVRPKILFGSTRLGSLFICAQTSQNCEDVVIHQLKISQIRGWGRLTHLRIGTSFHH